MFGKSLLPLGALLCLCAGTHASILDRWTPPGVVVGKIFRPTMVCSADGAAGIFKLEVRDDGNRVRRQMVSAETFRAYEIGDRFDPNGPLPPRLEIREMLAAEARKAFLELSVSDPPPSAAMPVPKRIATAKFTRDMLPDREGF